MHFDIISSINEFEIILICKDILTEVFILINNLKLIGKNLNISCESKYNYNFLKKNKSNRQNHLINIRYQNKNQQKINV